MAEAEAAEPNDPNAMALATVDAHGLPNVRMVLLKGLTRRRLRLLHQLRKRQGRRARPNPQGRAAALLEEPAPPGADRGPVELVSEAEADAYFATRSRESRVGAWASQQSRPSTSRDALEEAVAGYTTELAGRDVARPSYWEGFRVVPLEIEFWHGRPHRLHDRMCSGDRTRVRLRQDAALSVAAEVLSCVMAKIRTKNAGP